MKARSIDDIAKTEAEYWNENKLDRRKIKKLRRHTFHYSYKRESKFLQEKVKHFNVKTGGKFTVLSFVWNQLNDSSFLQKYCQSWARPLNPTK